MQVIARLFAFWRSLSPRVHVGISVGAILILLILGGVYAYVRMETSRAVEALPQDVPAVSIERTFEEGVHTISGTITLRNRCQRFDASGFLDDSTTPATIRVDLSSEHDDGICLEIPETRTFTLDVEAPEDARIEVYSNGIPTSGDAL